MQTAGRLDPRDPDDAEREPPSRLRELGLRPWQAEALAAWSGPCRGVVEAVTGTGKTRLAVAAIGLVVGRGGRALVVVPTLELLEQWVRSLRQHLPGIRVGRLGGGHDDDLHGSHVLVATPHSASAVPVDLPHGAVGLLVADEAHRYGASTWGGALHDVFRLRLALTATYERADDGIREVLEPYFGEVVYRYGFDRAVADGALAPFRIALAGVPLTPSERVEHEEADRRVRRLHGQLVGPLGMPREPRRLLQAVTAVVAEAEAGGSVGGPQVRACREYLVRVRERRVVAAGATRKLVLAGALAPALARRRSIVFTDTVDQAEDAARVLVSGGVAAETLHGELGQDRRRIRLAQFRRGRIDALVAPRVLDEGIDLPDADLAVVLAAFRTRRQLVQRLGRVLRRKPDDREAALVLAYAIGTAEDPDRGGHQGFLEQVSVAARSVDVFDTATQLPALTTWLSADRSRPAGAERGGRSGRPGERAPVS